MKRIFIFCPANLVTGGPEALHQLRYYMEISKIDATIVYFSDKFEEHHFPPERYTKYFISDNKYISFIDFNDNKDNLVIMPEYCSHKLLSRRITRSKKAIWWLGVGAYDGARHYSVSGRFSLDNLWCHYVNLKNKLVAMYIYHILHAKNYVGSQFAFEFVQKYLNQNCSMLVEPISQEFLKAGSVHCTDSDNRSNSILYNPAKKSKIMEQLLARAEISDLKFTPLKGFSPTELIYVYRSHKLYVDFGGFPGPERIPKEAVYNGCNILVGRANASINPIDIMIPEKYKVTDSSVEEIENKINNMLVMYTEQFHDFDMFRERIYNLEDNFIHDIKTLFSEYIYDN